MINTTFAEIQTIKMITNFETLTQAEFDKLTHGVAWIAVLIAGADGKIDSTEVSWASKIAKIRSYAGPDLLNDFYTEVGKDFEKNVADLIENSPKDTKARTAIAVEKVAELNPILAKLDTQMGALLYESFTSFATHVAKASGGFLRMWSVSYEENKYIDLPMLDKIEYVEE